PGRKPLGPQRLEWRQRLDSVAPCDSQEPARLCAGTTRARRGSEWHKPRWDDAADDGGGLRAKQHRAGTSRKRRGPEVEKLERPDRARPAKSGVSDIDNFTLGHPDAETVKLLTASSTVGQ